MEDGKALLSSFMMISKLNNQGIQQLMQHNHAVAIQSFRSIIHLVRNYAKTASCRTGTHPHCHHAMKLQVIQIQTVYVTDNGAVFFPVVFCISKCEDDAIDDEGEWTKVPTSLTMPTGIASSRRPTNHCKECQRLVCLLSTMACYNLAVAYHCQSMEGSRDRSTLVQMAIRHYRRAVKLTDHFLFCTATDPLNCNSCSNKESLGIMVVALGNNLALLLAELGDFEAVHECINSTLSKSRLPEKALLGPFLSNAVIWRLMESQPSAA